MSRLSHAVQNVGLPGAEKKRTVSHVESLEERSLFSAGLPHAAVVFDAVHAPTDVYVMPLRAEAGVSAAAPAAKVNTTVEVNVARPAVSLRPSDDAGVLTGSYADSQAFRAQIHPAEKAISSKGTEFLARHDFQSYGGMPPSALPTMQPPSGKGTVLLIEDDATSRVALTTILKRRGWKVVSASTMAEGMRQLVTDPENVIVDLMLPDGDGEQVLQEIRDSHLSAKVTVMTGVSDPARLHRLHDLHPEQILNKPINLAALMRSLGRAN